MFVFLPHEGATLAGTRSSWYPGLHGGPGWREVCGPQAPGDQPPCAESQQVVPGHRGGWKALPEGFKEDQTHQFGGWTRTNWPGKVSPRGQVAQEPPRPVSDVV